MTIHLRSVRETIEKAKRETTQRLRDELAEEAISRLQSQGRMPRHFHQSQQFKQTGDRA